ncbi:MAG: DNA-directed RNA polymerase subunit omega [Chthoniobacteraceae bacterium]
MTSHLIEEASKVVTSPQVLINIVSRRVRQLSQGHRPMIDAGPRMGFSDIALTEIIEGKLGFREEEQEVAVS